MKIFDSEFRNPVNFCLWNSESSKFLLVKSGIQKIIAFRSWNFCFWNSESRAWKCGTQLHESGIPLTIGIQNPSSTRNSGIQNPRLSWDGGHKKEKYATGTTWWKAQQVLGLTLAEHQNTSKRSFVFFWVCAIPLICHGKFFLCLSKLSWVLYQLLKETFIRWNFSFASNKCHSILEFHILISNQIG